MQNLALFLTKIQTFELRIVNKGELQNRIKEDERKPAYSLAHETHFTIHLAIGVKSGY